jgi:hypothetical protein
MHPYKIELNRLFLLYLGSKLFCLLFAPFKINDHLDFLKIN